MKYINSLIVAVVLGFSLLSGASATDHRVPPTEPHYWMKQYSGADPLKVQACLIVAQDVFYKKLKGSMDGVAWAVLHKGNAWEKCMDSRDK